MNQIQNHYFQPMQITKDLKIVTSYFEGLLLPANQFKEISLEINKLSLQVSKIVSDAENQEVYPQYIIDCVLLTLEHHGEEVDLLDQLVTIWSQAREQKQIKTKPIDEFFEDVEYISLWQLFVITAKEQKFTENYVRKMCKIIRRYSNMPTMWLYLHQISGDEIKTAYTF